MASVLGIYQEALEHLGERELASIAEDRPSRRALDSAYDRTVLFCLEQGFWNWAMRSVELEYEPAIEPAFGFSRAFTKPDDWLRTFVVSENDTHEPPIHSFLDENGYWMADTDTLYVRYVSNSADYGLSLTLWPSSFTAYVALALARRACRRISNSSDMYETLFKLEARAKVDAMSKDAINQGPQRMPSGTWVQSRLAGSGVSRWNDRFR